LEGNGRRSDILHRPELSKGSVEFVATSEYMWRPAKPPPYIFLLDVSTLAITSGMLKAAVQTIKRTLEKKIVEEPDLQVGFVTFDNVVHFYDLSPELQQPHMMVVADVSSVFVPLPRGALVEYAKSRDVIHAFLDRLPSLFATTTINEAVSGSAIEAALQALEETGGNALVFYCSLTVSGNGALKKRDDPKLLGTDKEASLLKPQIPYWTKLGESCANKQVAIDLFLFSHSYVDVASVGEVCRLSGGQLYYYAGLASPTALQQLASDIEVNLTRSAGYEAVLRTRCSNGFSVKGYLGSFSMKNSTDVDIAFLDSEKSLAVFFEHDSSLPDKANFIAQTAILYTTTRGERRIRVHNLCLQCTTAMQNLFRSADLYTIVNLRSRQALREAVQGGGLQQGRSLFLSHVLGVLAAYRKHCARAGTDSEQLILPEALKLLPVYTLALLKNGMLRLRSDVGADVLPDERAALILAYVSMPLDTATTFLYPNLFPLHNMPSECGQRDSYGVVVPGAVRLTIGSLDASGIYLLDDGIKMLIWVGVAANPALVHQLFGLKSLDGVDFSRFQFQELDNDYSARIHAIMRSLRKLAIADASTIQGKSQTPVVGVVIPQRDRLEIEVFSRLIEDKAHNQMSYADFLCHLHHHIRNKISG
jgi:protein transport protein SEC24